MSFIKRAVKKVFKFVKRLVKNKVFQVIAVIALSVFTAGVAAGGFAAFSGVSSIGGFFTAVGQTMATGVASIASSLGMTGTANAFAAKGGAAALKAGLVTSADTAAAIAAKAGAAAAKAGAAGNVSAAAAQGATAKAAAMAAHALPAAGSKAAAAVAGGVSGSGAGTTFSKLAGKKFLGKTAGEYATNAALMGMTNVMKQDARKQRFANGYVGGDVARGGGSYTGGVKGQDISGGSPVAPEPEETLASTQQAEIGEQGETLASQMAREEREEQGPVADYARGAGAEGLQSFAQQDQGQAAPASSVEDSGAGQVLLEPQSPQQGLLGDNPFADKATRIAYNPRRSGLIGA